MSSAEETPADSTWKTPQTPPTPWIDSRLPTEEDQVVRDPVDRESDDRDPVGYTTETALDDVGNTTSKASELSVNGSDEDPVVLEGGLARNTDSTPRTHCAPRSSDIVSLGDLERSSRTPRKKDTVLAVDQRLKLIPVSRMGGELEDPRTSPTTSTPGSTHAGSGMNDLKDSELHNSEESVIEASEIVTENKNEEILDDNVVLRMIDTSLAGQSDGDNLYESYESEDNSWETIEGDSTLQGSVIKSCIAKRTRSHDLRKKNLTQLTIDWSKAALEESFIFLGTNAVDSLDLHRADKAEVTWKNREEWCDKLLHLDTSMDTASKIGGHNRQLDRINIYNKKTVEIAKKNSELEVKGGGVLDSPRKDKENKRVTFIVEETAYTTAIQEVVKSLETLLEMDLNTAPQKNVENIIKIILSICLDYSNQVQIVQETMESMARLIRELLILKGRMVKQEADNAKLKVANAAKTAKILHLETLYKITSDFAASLAGGARGRDFTYEITQKTAEICGLKQAARERESTYKKAFDRKDDYKAEVMELKKAIASLESSRREEKMKENDLAQVRVAQIESLSTRWEQESMRANTLEEEMKEMKINHRKELADCVEEQSRLGESVHGERLRALTQVEELEDKLRRTRSDINQKLRDRDAELDRRAAKIKENTVSISQKDGEISGLKELMETQKEDLKKTRKECKMFKKQCRVFGCKDTNEPMETIHSEEGPESGTNSTSEASYIDLQSSSTGIWGDTSNMDVTNEKDDNSNTESQTLKQKGEKRKRKEAVEARSADKKDELKLSDVSSEESPTTYKSGSESEHSKRKRQSKNKGSSRRDATQQDLSKIVYDLKVDHQKQLATQKEKFQEELDNMKKVLIQKNNQAREEMRRKMEAESATRESSEGAENVQNSQVSSQGSEEPRDPPLQNRKARSPIVVAINDENRHKVLSQFKGLLINNDGTVTMTQQFLTWSTSQDIQLQEEFRTTPQIPSNVNNDSHPPPTNWNLVWTHSGEWARVPYSVNDKGPNYKETLVARVERCIDLQGNINRAISYGDEDTKLCVWFDLGEVLKAFPHWDLPKPCIYFNARKFSSSGVKPKEGEKPVKPYRGRGGYRGSRRGNPGNKNNRRPETYEEWNQEQDGGNGNQGQGHEQNSWNQHQQSMQQQGQQQQQQYQPQASQLPPPAQVPIPSGQQQHYTPVNMGVPTGQQQYQYPTPVTTQQYYGTAPTQVPGLPTHVYHHPLVPVSDQHHYQHSMVGGARPKEYRHRDQSRGQYSDEYPRGRRSSRERSRRSSRDRDGRRYSSQESEGREPQGYTTREYEKRRGEESHSKRARDESSYRHRNRSRDRQRDRKPSRRSTSPDNRRRSERTPSPTNSGIGRGGSRKDRDQNPKKEDGKDRGRGQQDKRGSDTSYGES